jgi:hypothetical protein
VSCPICRLWPRACYRALGSVRHGPLAVSARARVHQMIHRGCGGWEDRPARAEYPVIEGTLIRPAITRPAPGSTAPEPMWLWASAPDALASRARAPGRFEEQAESVPSPGGKNTQTAHNPERPPQADKADRLRGKPWPFHFVVANRVPGYTRCGHHRGLPSQRASAHDPSSSSFRQDPVTGARNKVHLM